MRIDQVLVGVAGAQRRLETVSGRLRDHDVRAPSGLEEWTRGHVLTHLARNADSQTGMLDGVSRGEIVAQYPGGDQQRSRDIEVGAYRSAGEIVDDRLPLRLPAPLRGD